MLYKSRSSIQKIECARNLPANKISLMARCLDVSPSYLMGWEDGREAPDIQVHADDAFTRRRLMDIVAQYDNETLSRLIEYYERYKNSLPEIQAAVDDLLKPQ